jgi:hypothetical protein
MFRLRSDAKECVYLLKSNAEKRFSLSGFLKDQIRPAILSFAVAQVVPGNLLA